MFDRYVQRWQDRQRPVGPIYQSGETSVAQSVRQVSVTSQTGSPHYMVTNQHTASTSAQPNSSNDFHKVLAEYKNDLAKLIKENLRVDVRDKTRTYEKPYPISFDRFSTLLELFFHGLVHYHGLVH